MIFRNNYVMKQIIIIISQKKLFIKEKIVKYYVQRRERKK